MSQSGRKVSIKDIPDIVTAPPVTVPVTVKVILGAMIVVGLMSFFLTLKSSPVHAWAIFHVNTIFWLFLAAASAGFSAVFQICNAEWARPVRRLFESTYKFLYVGAACLLILFLAGAYQELFAWTFDEHLQRHGWLTPNFVYFRDLAVVLLFIIIVRKVIHLSLRQDIGVIRSGLTGVSDEGVKRWFDPSYDSLVADWGHDTPAEIAECSRKRGFNSPLVVIVYSFGFGLIAFDQLMSVDAHWYSTLFGAFVFMAGVYFAVAWNSMVVPLARELHPLLKRTVVKNTLWDLGKLLFGFGIFWAYLFWSHYLTIWYGNIPEETGWLITRTRLEPWHTFGWFVLWASFICPFLLGLSRDVKQVPHLLFSTGLIVTLGQWAFIYILFVPTLSPFEIPFAPQDIGISLGFAAAFAICAINFLQRYPLIPFGDLLGKK